MNLDPARNTPKLHSDGSSSLYSKGKGWKSFCISSSGEAFKLVWEELQLQHGSGSDPSPGGGGGGGGCLVQTGKAGFVVVSTTHQPVCNIAKAWTKHTKLAPHLHLQPEQEIYPTDQLFRRSAYFQRVICHYTNIYWAPSILLGILLHMSDAVMSKADTCPSGIFNVVQ